MSDCSAIARLLAEVQAGLERVQPRDLAAVQDAGALVVDIRPVEQRERDGELPGALVVGRNVLEWRLDPTSPDRLPVAEDPGRRVVLVCDEGYSSSLAAHTLRQLGLVNATDLAGGFQAWLAAQTPGDADRGGRRSPGDADPPRSARMRPEDGRRPTSARLPSRT